MSLDLFTDAINQVTAIDCRIDENMIHVGAIYLESETPYDQIRISNGERSFYIHLPEDLLHKPDAYYGWNLRFDITETETQEARLLPAGPPAEPTDHDPSYPLSA